MIPPDLFSRGSSVLVVATAVLLCGPAGADPQDAGAPLADSGSSTGQAKPADASSDLPSPGSAAWVARQVRLSASRLAKLRARVQAIGRLEATARRPPKGPLTAEFTVDFDDAAAVKKRVAALRAEEAALAGKVARSQARLDAVRPALEAPRKRLEQLQQLKLKRRWTRIPDHLPGQAAESQQRLEVLVLEHRLVQAEAALLFAKRGYLLGSQPARQAARQRQDELEREAEAERQAASLARRQAKAEGQAAEKAHLEALVAQQRARSEAERSLSAESARLQGVRVKQAQLKQSLARDKAALAQRRTRQERFRGEIARRADLLGKLWPRTAPKFDVLYDRVVAELTRLRPEEVAGLYAALGGLPDVPHPGDRLAERVLLLDGVFATTVKDLEALRSRLAVAAAQMSVRQRKLLHARLKFLHRETSGLNKHRLALLSRVTEAKRARLTGITRETLDQLNREITQLAVDGLYWVFSRLGQIDLLPRLIRDVFTVGSLLWTLIKILALLVALRVVLRRWDDWMRGAVRQVSQTVSLGSQALKVAKLIDAVRFIGPPLLTLLVVTLVYTLLGGSQAAAAELHYLYVVAFWLAVYRVAVRLVEYVAKYMGIQLALREVEGIPQDEDSAELDGPPEPSDASAGEGQAAGAKGPLTPAPTLLVRSMRSATRYVLVVILILELTAMAVGKGTIFRLTAEFSWWAAAFFAFYFLVLWGAHIEHAYERLQEGKSTRGVLARMVRASRDHFYGVFVIAAALVVVLMDRIANFGRQYLTSRNAMRKLSAFFFRRQVERHAQEQGKVLDRRRRDLPPELLEHFPMGPLEPSAKPMRPELMDELAELFASWKEEHSDGSVAVVGRTGMGKSTVLQLVERELQVSVFYGDVRTKITRPAKVVSWLAEVFSISPKPSSERDLIKRIREDRTQVVAVDNCHNLFLRRVGGFEGWESFLRVVNETCDNVFWILAFNQAAFDYLNAITGHSNYLRRIFVLPRWTERQIRRDIMMKMRRGRVGVSFSDLLMARLQGISMSTQLGRTSSGYFRMLWDFTGGIPRLASHFWLDSLVPEQEAKMVRVHLFSTPDRDELERLSTDMLFVLTAIAEHENLTRQEVIVTTSLPADFCNFACRYCLEEGYLKLNRDTNRLRLNWRWQQPIHRFLRRKRLLSS